MQLAIVADSDLKERARCVRSLAREASVSAIGVENWEELDQALADVSLVSLFIYAPPFPGAPDDIVARLLSRAARVVITSAEGAPHGLSADDSPMRATRPLSDETLTLLARGAGPHSSRHSFSFATVDFLQMLCMAGGSHLLVISHDDIDVGIIEVRDGRVWTAFDGLGVGEDAFARLVRPEMRARVSPMLGAPKERTILLEFNVLVLDSLRRIDEGSVPLPPPLYARESEATLALPEQLAIRIKELHADARRLLMARHYDDAARVFANLSELEPTSSIVRANLEQLRKLGYTQ
jgi:hypothetical protein